MAWKRKPPDDDHVGIGLAQHRIAEDAAGSMA